jgi:hypothetical protein
VFFGVAAIAFSSTLDGTSNLTVNTTGTTTFGGAVGGTHLHIPLPAQEQHLVGRGRDDRLLQHEFQEIREALQQTPGSDHVRAAPELHRRPDLPIRQQDIGDEDQETRKQQQRLAGHDQQRHEPRRLHHEIAQHDEGHEAENRQQAEHDLQERLNAVKGRIDE